MNQEPNGPVLSAVFVDYDNIYLSLRRKSEEAAKRFSKDAGFWIKEITTGNIVTPTNGLLATRSRRLVMARCYGNPVPRRNTSDNTTDMNSFPFVRHHFLRGGFEVVDCPPLTAQLKNSADIRMVMDMRDLLNHDTYYDEFIILSSDADFTPMLHRLRAHARHTVIYANDYTAAPYTAICDGEVREADLLRLLLDGKISESPAAPQVANESPSVAQARIRDEIISTVVNAVRTADQPVPLEALAERTTRALGHDQTVGSSWAGAGGFLELLRKELPAEIQLTTQPPYLAYDVKRAVASETPQPAPVQAQAPAPAIASQPQQQPKPVAAKPLQTVQPRESQFTETEQPVRAASDTMELDRRAPVQQHRQFSDDAEPASIPLDSKSEALQRSMARIRDASQVPILSPTDYRKLFVAMAQEINENNLQGAQTISNIMSRAAERNVEVRRDDVRFILEVVSEADPWFEQGASANLFAGRFHNFVVARCRSQGLDLSIDDLELIEAWFAGNGEPMQGIRSQPAPEPVVAKPLSRFDDGARDDFPRILQNRLRV